MHLRLGSSGLLLASHHHDIWKEGVQALPHSDPHGRWWGWAEDPAEQPAFFFQVECLPGPGLFQGLSFFWFMAMLAGFSVTTPRNSSENSNLYCVLTSSCRPRGQRSQNEGCLSEGRGSPPRRPTGDPGLNLGAGVWPLSQTRKPSASAILGLSAPQTPTLFYSYEER